MAAFFQLFLRSNPSEPVDLNDLDKEICDMLGIAIHERKYAYGWFDSIGFRIATGLSLGSDQLRTEIKETGIAELVTILEFLELRYQSTSWHGRG